MKKEGKMKEKREQKEKSKKEEEKENKIGNNCLKIRKFYKILGFYIDIFQKNF